MRRPEAPSFWIAVALAVSIAVSLVGCASTDSSTVVAVSDFKSVAGKWAGVIEGRPAGQYDYIEVMIRDDGTYDVTTSRTIGKASGRGKITLRDGQLLLQGDHGHGVGTLMSGQGGERVLKVDVTFASPGSVSGTVQSNLRPTR